jgi:TonB family protein
LDDDATTAVAAKTVPKQASAAVNQSQVNQAKLNQEKSARAHATRKLIAAQTSNQPQPAAASAVQRTVLPPLDVEVIAGDAHHRVHPGSNAAKLQITNQDSSTLAAPTNASEREPVADAPQESYPLLAQHMNVQGSVVLQAVIGADGIIQTLHVVSGPAILASAAQQAVREWRFKPVMQNGSPVETKARITVNFTIKVGENTGTTLAQSRTEDIQILSR